MDRRDGNTSGPIHLTGGTTATLLRTLSSSKHSELKSSDPQPDTSDAVPQGQATIELPRWRFWAVFCSILLTVFLFALDQLIVATAIPKITVQFHSLTQLPWLASGFFLPLFGLNLIYAQALEICPSKHVVMFAVVVFEVGSLICGVAPNMEVLILGRAVAGAGAAGIFSGNMVVVAELTPLHNRAAYFAYLGICFAVASVIGPLVGGAFADHVSWRWCFYINLPFGGVALACYAAFQPCVPPMGRRTTYKGYSWAMLKQFAMLDWVGAALSMAWATCLILGLQYGGVTRKWNDGSVIALLVLTGAFIPIFLLWEWFVGPEHQMFKFHLLRSHTTSASAVTLFFLFAVFMIDVYYLSVGFQAVYHFSATDAGIRLLPLIFVQIAFLVISGRVLIPRLRRYKWVITAGPAFLALGSGLLYTVKYGTPVANIYGFEVLLGIGIGLCLQNAMLAVQYDLKNRPHFISAGVGLCTFLGFMGRIVGISLASSVFQNMIQRNLHKYAPQMPQTFVKAIVNDATAVWTTVPEQFRTSALIAYTETLRVVFIIGVPMSVLAVVSALFIVDAKLPSKEEEAANNEALKEKEAREDEAAHKGRDDAAAATLPTVSKEAGSQV